jgi:rhodanese-related sulfurtransferase
MSNPYYRTMNKRFLLLICLLTTPLWGAKSPDISIEELEQAIKDKRVAIIDVNGATSFQNGHIPGAINFAAGKDNLKDSLPSSKDTLVVAYCGGPSCRAYQRGIEAAAELGYINLKHLSAGISGWKKAGKAISK